MRFGMRGWTTERATGAVVVATEPWTPVRQRGQGWLLPAIQQA